MVAAAVPTGGGLLVAVITALSGSITSLEMLLILLLARPMVSFLFVLASLEARSPE
jgi:hypothetical protein